MTPLTETQKRVADYLGKLRLGTSAKVIARVLSLPIEVVEETCADLVESGLLRVVRRNRSGLKYGIVDNGRRVERQNTRERDGRYAQMNRCERCGKVAGDRRAEYYSDDRCNRLGHGLVLCAKCAHKLAMINDDKAYVAEFS